MLTNVKIQNFRALRELEVPLRPLTVLIGANDTGKSAFLAAVDRAVNGTWVGTQSDFWLGNRQLRPTVELIEESGRTSVVSLTYDESRRSYHPSINPTEAHSCVLFALPSKGVVMESEGYPDGFGMHYLSSEGRGIPSLLDYLLRRNRERFDLIVEVLRRYIPGLQDIEIATPEPAMRRLDLVLSNGLRLKADEASAGVRLLIFFVALAYQPYPPQVILVEEPENGVHPKRLAEIVSLLRDITVGKHGYQASQVILTTHSPYLLDSIDPEVDQVLVFRRNEDSSRSAEPVDTERLKVFLDEFMLGEVWFSQGEEGLVAKRS